MKELKYYLGIDLGGTNTKIGLVDEEGIVVYKGSVPTYIEEGPRAACERVAAKVEVILSQSGVSRSQIIATGLASAGTMDIPGRMLMVPANLGEKWNYCPICDMMSEACGFPVVFSNDASAAAYAEFWIGKGRDAKKSRMARTGVQKTDVPINSMILLTLGTGIGCGIILNRCVYDGEHSHGGEYGHSIMDLSPEARVCGCGRAGHFEAYGSAKALVARAKEVIRSGRETSLRKRVEDLDLSGAKIVGEEALAGDVVAGELIEENAGFIAVGITNLMHTLDPDAIFIGGAMTFGGEKTELGRKYLQKIKDEVQKRAYAVCFHTTIIDFALLGGDAGFIGAAGIAKTHQEKNF
ncbi:MAG: ROK family protein [Planctomycetia bacterium]|nr:ROK family protein [Planctomycetia bacterium]